MLPKASWIFSFDDKNLQTRLKLVGDHPGGGGGGDTWVFFGWVSAAWDSKLAPRSRNNFP